MALPGLPLFQRATGSSRRIPLQAWRGRRRDRTWDWRPGGTATLQSEFDTWFNQRIGLRGFFVRTSNQINYTLFRRVAQERGTQVLIGKGGFLFEKAYVGCLQPGRRALPEAELQVGAATRRLQDELAARGIAFLLVIAPSKAEIYPDFLPDSRRGRAAGRRSDYQNIVDPAASTA